MVAHANYVDYVISVPIRVASGRMKITVQGSNGKIRSSTVVEAQEGVEPSAQPAQQLLLAFIAPKGEQVKLVLSNEASNPPRPSVRLGTIYSYELGPARFLWTRYPRFIIYAIQKVFLTAVILPLAIIGLLIAIFKKQSAALVVLSVVPIYFFMVQSIVHTEYRYVLAVDYFLFAFAGVALCFGLQVAGRIISAGRMESVPSA